MPTPVEGGIWIKKECLPSPFGGDIHCLITVTNSGDTILDAPVAFFDAATILAGPGAGGAVTIVAAAPDVPQWVCMLTPAPTSPAAAARMLPPGVSHSVDVSIDTGRSCPPATMASATARPAGAGARRRLRRRRREL